MGCNNNGGVPVTAVVADTFPVIRILLNDLNPLWPEFANSTLQQTVAAILLLRQIPGYGLSPDGTTITPAFPNANGFALVCYKAARTLMVGLPEKYSMRTRAFSENIGNARRSIMDLDKYIYDIESECGIVGWQSFYSFLAGISNLSLLEVFTNMKVNSPFYSVTLTATGGTAAS